jgi:sarcosine oxidase, subunit gamma
MRYDLTITERFDALITIRATQQRRATIEATLGFALPQPGRSNGDAARTCLGVARDEWLLVAPVAQESTVFTQLDDAINGDGGIVVVMSNAHCCLELRGAGLADVMAQIVPLDLDTSAFPIGAATRTAFGRSSALIHRREQQFDIYIDTTVARYGRVLIEACCGK